MTDKEKIRKEVERLRNLHQMKYQQLDTNDNMCLVECGKRNLCNELLSFIDSLQEEPVSGLDNGDMSVERWKQAVEAASNQRNYRSSKGLTETRDDYFVDGVQWADEHPIKSKEVDLEKEFDSFAYTLPRSAIGDGPLDKHFDDPKIIEARNHGWRHSWSYKEALKIARHFFELGLKTQHSSIGIPNIDNIFEEEGIDPNSKDAKISKECYYMALEKLKAQKGEGV